MIQQLKRIQARLATRPDTEHHQCYLRMLAAISGFIYFTVATTYSQPNHALPYTSNVIILGVGALVGGLGLFVHILYFPAKNHIRRWLGIVHDSVWIGAYVWALGDHAFASAAMYFWIVIGNGFRYGPTFLFGSAALGLISFLTVAHYNPYLNGKTDILIFMVFTLGIVIPIYMGSLLRSLNKNLRAAVAADRLKTQFLANVSHDLRTPLNSILSVSESLSRRQPDGSGRLRQINDMYEAARSLNAMVNDLLDVAKIEAGRVTFTNEWFGCPELLGNVFRSGRTLAADKPIELYLTLDPGLPLRIHGDQLRIKQVLTNLMGNAIKYTDNGHVHLHARPLIDPATKRPNGVVFEFRDTGIGLTDEEITEIFLPFKQADKSYVRRYSGAGLGLTIVNDFVARMGGRIEVSSAKGRGSRFTVSLPIPVENTGTTARDAQHAGNNLVLICQDEDRKSGWEAALGRDGWQHFSVFTVEEGIYALRSGLQGGIMQYPIDDTFVVVDCDGLQIAMGDVPITSDVPEWRDAYTWIGINVPDNANHRGDYSNKLARYRCLLGAYASSALANAVALCRLCETAPDPKRSISETIRGYATRLAGKRILVADDNELNQRVLQEMLSYEGLHVSTVADGERALKALSEENFDIAILDIQMPKLSGIDVIRQYTRDNPSGTTKLLAFTADTTDECRIRTLNAGADDVLYKPVTTLDLLACMAALFDHRERHLSSEHATPEPATQSGELLDYALLRELQLTSRHKDYITSLVKCFEDDGGTLIKELGVKLDNDDHAAAHTVLHRLKGMSATIGAAAFANACKLAMQPGTNDDLALPPDLHEQLSSLHKASVNALYAFAA